MDGKTTVNPARNAEPPLGIYVPCDLEDALLELSRLLPPDLIQEMQNLPENGLCGTFHFTLGAWMRSHWGLWTGSRLCAFFQDMGIHHADDMTHIIMDSFWRRLNRKPLSLAALVRRSKHYWDNPSAAP